MRQIKSKDSVVVKNFRNGTKKNKSTPKPFPIVGIGASAGGVEAFIELASHLSPNLGMAYVLIMHLSPNHKSALAEIIQSKTKMKVQTVTNGMEVLANNIYVIPPNTFMSLVDGHLKLATRSRSLAGNIAIDYFLTGLATIYKNNAIGVILSGTGTDGTLGLKAIKAEGGITFVQDESAEFSGMPQNAFNSGYADFMLSPERIANELAELVKIPYTILPADEIETDQVKQFEIHSEELKEILSIVRTTSGIDFFHHYKRASVQRRLLRRMALAKVNQLHDYYSILKENPKEVEALYNDFLINVTSFFRDPDFFKTLNDQIFPALVEHEKQSGSIRIWVAGCSTGEEAYSIAISLIEFLEKVEEKIPIQIFASDLDETAIEKARLGIYSISALQQVTPIHLSHFFLKLKEGHYQIVKSVRDVCIFSKQNLLKDPPFSRVNLVSCQNLLIYLETNPQLRILQTFHYALKSGGYLFLGKSETIGVASELFDHLDKKIKVYLRKDTKSPQLQFSVNARDSTSPNPSRSPGPHADFDFRDEKDVSKLILTRFVHPCVVLNKSFVIIQFFGVTAPYLSPVVGNASLNVLKMIREDLVIELGSLLQQARKTETIAFKDGINIRINKVLHEISIEVIPKKTSKDTIFLVVFKEKGIIQIPQTSSRKSGEKSVDQKDKMISKLQEELIHSRGLVRATHEEYETTYEELQANSEEILSSNEELQSVNEELETSKEELQASNEELTTINQELAKRNKELSESQERLKRINEHLEEFTFMASHDLQEPLRKLQTFSSALMDTKADLNDYAKMTAAKINASASRMSNLLKDLLSYSLLADGADNKFELVDLNKLMREVIEDFDSIIAEKKVMVNVSSLPTLSGVPVRMRQLFHNLISNALKFSKENPVINITSKEVMAQDYADYPVLVKGTRYVSIIVEDNGIGFNQKYASKIFVLFQRLNDSKDMPGTGIGLSMCKKIVEDLNGFIFTTSVEGSGTTFKLFLPAA